MAQGELRQRDTNVLVLVEVGRSASGSGGTRVSAVAALTAETLLVSDQEALTRLAVGVPLATAPYACCGRAGYRGEARENRSPLTVANRLEQRLVDLLVKGRDFLLPLSE